jgi:PAS domain S-box-containing protein
MLGHDPVAYTLSAERWAESLHPDDAGRAWGLYRDYVEGRVPEYRSQFRMRTAAGGWKWVLSVGRIVERDARGRPLRMLGTHTDIDLEKAQEARDRWLARLYAALGRSNEAIVRCADRETLCREICRIAVDDGGLRMAWIGWLDTESRQVLPAVSHGQGTEYLEGLVVSADPSRPEGRGATGEALRTGRHAVVNDFLTDARARPWLAAAHEAGFRASGAFPIREGGRVVGTLNLYADEPHYFTDEKLVLLDQLGADLSLALDRLAGEAMRQRNEAELRSAEARFRATFEQAAVGIAHVAPDGRWLQVNNRLCDIVGYARGELLELTFQQITHPDDIAKDLGQAKRLLDGAIPYYALEKRYLRKDGRTVWINLTVSLVRNGAGKPDYLVKVVEDIGARKAAEQALRALADDLAKAQRIARLGSWTLDFATGTGTWSDEMCHIFGWQPARGAPDFETFLSLVDPHDHPVLTSIAGRAFESGESVDIDFRSAPDRGPVRHFAAHAEPVRDPTGRVVGLIGITQDVTEQREARARQVELTEHLRALSRRLLSVQEEERRALARELHDEIGQQLAALKLNLAILEREVPGEPRLADSLAIADQTIEHVRNTALNLRPSVLDDLGLAASLNWYARRQAGRTGCRIEVSAELPRLNRDVETAVFRIVQESVNNAIRHGHPRRVGVDAHIAGGAVRIAIEDDGRGFEPDLAAGRDEGLGLGGMRERAELLGGTLSLSSRPGAGTRIEASIPLQEATP